MSTRNLDSIFRAQSIALVGASARECSVGFVTARNLISAGFSGPIYFVNPKYDSLLGRPVYRDVAALPQAPELAILCTPPATVPAIIRQLAESGTRGAIVITAGFREVDAGRELEASMLEGGRQHLLRVIGPNCLGVLSTVKGINASFAPSNAGKGGLAFVTQSGAIATTMLDWANSRGIGFSHLVSLGDMSDVDFGDMLDYLADDRDTTAILLYIEAVTHARKFLSAARAAARLKPVIAIKAGRHAAAARAAASHTGALAGIDEVYDAAFARAGIVRVATLDELFDAAETLAVASGIAAPELVILTNGGGAGVLATDALSDLGGRLTELSRETVLKLNTVLPRTWSQANPADIIGDAPPSRYIDSLSILLQAPETSAVLVINCPTAVSSSTAAADAVAQLAMGARVPVLTNWLGAESTREAREHFARARVPTYETPEKAVRGFIHLVRYRQGQNTLLEVPSSTSRVFMPDEKHARALLVDARSGWLPPETLGAVLEAYGIPMVRSVMTSSTEEAGRRGGALGGPVALKVVSPDIIHKADVGGVVLDLEGETEIRTAAEAMVARIAQLKPHARVSGFLVQEIARRADAYEVILGSVVDAQFGPFLLFGAGGSAVEVIADKAIALPPLNLALARDMISSTRIYGQLKGFRHRPPVALDVLALTLVKLSQLICDFDEIVELEINPLLVDSDGVIALDARARIEPLSDAPRGARLAIRPYPKHLEREINLPEVGPCLVRPVRPEDAPQLVAILESLRSMKESGLVTVTRRLEPERRARLSQIDYEREMAFLLLPVGETSGKHAAGFVHIAADPDYHRAEFALAVDAVFGGRGQGAILLQHMIDYARTRGITEISASVAEGNAPMMELCNELGFAQTKPEGGTVRVSLMLRA